MKNTVLFLGAGMSATFGYPLTADLLPKIVQKIQNESLFSDLVARDQKDTARIYRLLLKTCW